MQTSAADARFFQRVSLLFLLLTLLGFWTTYLLPVARGRFEGQAILHIHGVLFLAWPVLFLAQTHSIGRSRGWHQSLGFVAISLATAMLITGLLAIGSSINAWQDRGVGVAGQAISLIAFAGIAMFSIFFGLAIAAIRSRTAHPRLMALATLSIMQAVSARLALTAALGGNPEMLRPGLLPPVDPVRTIVPHVVLDLLVIGWMARHDWRVLGRFHPVTIFGGSAIVLVHACRHFLAESAWWLAIARFLSEL